MQAKAYGITEEALLHDPRFDRTTAAICSTGHTNTHELIRRSLNGDKMPHARGKTLKMARYAVDKYRAAGGK